MNGRRTLSMVLMLAVLVPAWSALAQKRAGAPARRAPVAIPAPGAGSGPAVAKVGSMSLPREELDARTQQALAQYRQSSGERELPREMIDLLRRQVLESMIRMQLLAYEADRTGVRGTSAEAEAALKLSPVFNPGGAFDAARYEGVKTTQRAAWESSIQLIQRQLGARQLYVSLESRFAPTEAETRHAASRQLARALVEHLPLRAADFNGAYPEPRESQVLEWYAAHREDYRRPERVTATVVFVSDAGATDSLRRDPGSREAWSRRGRVAAEVALARIAAGASFDSATADWPERASAVMMRDNFPGYWRGTAAQVARLFDPRQTGRPIAEPIEADEGWLLVRPDRLEPARVAPLREVAREIRAQLRADIRLHYEEREERELYASVRDSLAGTGWKLRYAAVDTSAIAVAEPTEAELERWYRAHLADYSFFDGTTGSIRSQPLTEVRDEIRRRLIREQRVQRGRNMADQLGRAWAAGKRDGGLEARLAVRETPPVIPGSVIDTGLVATQLADTLWGLGEPRGTGTVPFARGWIVWSALQRVEKVVPTFEQARPALAVRLQRRRAAADLAGARRLFAADSMRFHRGEIVRFSRFAVAPPPLMAVPLTRAEVEKWQHDHMDKFSAPELVTARHILVRTRDDSPEADRAARAKAEDILRRAQAGEDFGLLAKTYSDDPATSDVGGDLGAFGRGTMLDAFEKAAFAMSAGDLSEQPVHTEVGYHIIKCVDHVPAFVQPLALIYPNVAADAAKAKADQIARARADSLLSRARTPQNLRAGAARLGYPLFSQAISHGEDLRNPLVQPFFDRLYKLAPGQVVPPHFVPGDGFWIGWVDSLTPPVPPTWADAREAAMAEYRRGAGRRALEAKQAELDSLFAAGWSLDSLGALFGGLERSLDVTPTRGLQGLGASAAFDSVVFGTRASDGPPLGQVSGWIELPGGTTRLRVADRVPPPSDQLTTRAASLRAGELERRLRVHFEELRRRYPVKILDPTLVDVSLPEPPPGLNP